MSEEATELYGWEISVLFLLFMFISCAWQVFIAVVSFLNSFYGDAKTIWLERLKDEVLDVGVISLVLIFIGPYISNICVHSSSHSSSEDATFSPPPSSDSSLLHAARRLLSGDAAAPCPAGKRHLFPPGSISTAHYLLFFVALIHIIYSVLTFTLTLQRFSRWDKWEDKARKAAMDAAELTCVDSPQAQKSSSPGRRLRHAIRGSCCCRGPLAALWRGLQGGVDSRRYMALRGLFQLRSRAHRVRAFGDNLHFTNVCQAAMEIDLAHVVSHGWLQALIMACFTLYTTQAYQIVVIGGVCTLVELAVVIKMQWVLHQVLKVVQESGSPDGLPTYTIDTDHPDFRRWDSCDSSSSSDSVSGGEEDDDLRSSFEYSSSSSSSYSLTTSSNRSTNTGSNRGSSSRGGGAARKSSARRVSRQLAVAAADRRAGSGSGSKLGNRPNGVRTMSEPISTQSRSAGPIGEARYTRSDWPRPKTGTRYGPKSGSRSPGLRSGPGPLGEALEEEHLSDGGGGVAEGPSATKRFRALSSWSHTFDAYGCAGGTAGPSAHHGEAKVGSDPGDLLSAYSFGSSNPLYGLENTSDELPPPPPRHVLHPPAQQPEMAPYAEEDDDTSASGGERPRPPPPPPPARYNGGGGTAAASASTSSATKDVVGGLGGGGGNKRQFANPLFRRGSKVKSSSTARATAAEATQGAASAAAASTAPVAAVAPAGDIARGSGGIAGPLSRRFLGMLHTVSSGASTEFVAWDETFAAGGGGGNAGGVAAVGAPVAEATTPCAPGLAPHSAAPAPQPASLGGVTEPRGTPLLPLTHGAAAGIPTAASASPASTYGSSANNFVGDVGSGTTVAASAPTNEVELLPVGGQDGGSSGGGGVEGGEPLAGSLALLPSAEAAAEGDGETAGGAGGDGSGRRRRDSPRVDMDRVERKLRGLFWFRKPKLMIWLSHINFLQNSMSVTLCIYVLATYGTGSSILKMDDRLLYVWVPLLAADLLLMLYMGWVVVPLYTLLTTTATRHPALLHTNIRRIKKVEEEEEGGVTGLVLSLFTRCFRHSHHAAKEEAARTAHRHHSQHHARHLHPYGRTPTHGHGRSHSHSHSHGQGHNNGPSAGDGRAAGATALNAVFVTHLANQAGVILAEGAEFGGTRRLGTAAAVYREYVDVWRAKVRVRRGEQEPPPGGVWVLAADVSEFRAAFRRLDRDGSGYVTVDELLTQLHVTAATHASRAELRAMMANVDTDGDKGMSFREYLTFMVFSFFDHNGNSAVEVGDVRKMARRVSVKLHKAEVEAMVELADPDGDRKIGLRQFFKLFRDVGIPEQAPRRPLPDTSSTRTHTSSARNNAAAASTTTAAATAATTAAATITTSSSTATTASSTHFTSSRPTAGAASATGMAKSRLARASSEAVSAAAAAATAVYSGSGGGVGGGGERHGGGKAAAAAAAADGISGGGGSGRDLGGSPSLSSSVGNASGREKYRQLRVVVADPPGSV